MTTEERIKVQAFTIESTTIETTAAQWRAAKKSDDLDGQFDTHLSDMDGETVIIDPDDGSVINPYGGTTDLMELLTPILDAVPTWRIEQYATGRRADEE